MDSARWDGVIQACTPRTDWSRVNYKIDLPNAVDLGMFIRPEKRNALRAIVTLDLMDEWDAGSWLHLSVSRPLRLPTWSDLVIAREELGFADRIFVQLLPPRAYWLNIAGYVLHLLHRVDADTVPPMLWQTEGADGAGYRKPGTLDGRGQVR